jgi:hypothetical protein
LAGFFTKPLQRRSLFREFQNQVLHINTDPTNATAGDHRSVLTNQTNGKDNKNGKVLMKCHLNNSGPPKSSTMEFEELPGTQSSHIKIRPDLHDGITQEARRPSYCGCLNGTESLLRPNLAFQQGRETNQEHPSTVNEMM